MSIPRQALIPAVLAALLCLFAGCAPLIVGGGAALGTYAYIDGQSQAVFETDAPTVFQATRTALAEMSIPVVEEWHHQTAGAVEGVFDGDKVKVSFSRENVKYVRIKVRVGLVGNRESSNRILNAIGKHL